MVAIKISIKSNSSPGIYIVSLNDINTNDNVQTLKKKLNDMQKIDGQKVEFVYQGNILKDDEMLDDIGINGGSMIYCFPKTDTSPPTAPPLSLIEVQQLLVSLRAAVGSSNFINYIQKLRTQDQIARLVSECPALKRDPSSLAYIQDTDLVSILQNADVLSQVVEDRPVIGRVLQIVCNLITSEITSPRRSHHISYSMDALSDEEMEIDQNEMDSRRTGSSSFQPVITPAQLAAALANATGGSGGLGWGGLSASSAPRSGLTTPSSLSTPFNTPAPPSGSGAGASPGGSVITTEMFSQALQNALAASASSTSGALSGGSPIGSSNPPIENVEESLQLMREMGIPDEEMSLQALQATNGDVQAAINLIFAQWMADD